jgi:hypothetical protein
LTDSDCNELSIESNGDGLVFDSSDDELSITSGVDGLLIVSNMDESLSLKNIN